MEAGNGAAGDGDKQNREQIAGALHIEAGEGRQIHRGVGGKDANDGGQDHGDQQVAVQVVAGLEQRPDGNNRSNKNIGKDDEVPGAAGNKHGGIQADDNGRHQHHNGNPGVHPLVQLRIADDEAQSNGHQNKQHGRGGDGAVGGNLRSLGVEALEGAGDHIGKGRDDQDAEEPAERKEELLAVFADIALNDIADGAALVLHRGIHGHKVLHRAEEYAADQNPEQHRNPAEHRSLDRAVDGACAGDGRKLMAEDNIGVRGFIVNTVLQLVGGGFCVGINAPGLGQPSAVEQIGAAQYHNGNDHHENTVHVLLSSNISLSFSGKLLFSTAERRKKDFLSVTRDEVFLRGTTLRVRIPRATHRAAAAHIP